VLCCRRIATGNRRNNNNWKLRNQNKQRKHWRISRAKDTSSPKIDHPIPALLSEPKIEERSSNLNDPEQVKAIYHYLLIVADKNYSDKDRADAAEHLAIHYFKRPIFPTDWNINQARILREIKESKVGIIQRTKSCLFEAVGVMNAITVDFPHLFSEAEQTKKDAVEAVRNKLSITMLVYLLGEGWRNEPRRSEIMGLGIGEGRELSLIDFILNETYGDNDPSYFSPQSTMNSPTDGATGARLNSTPCRDTFGLDDEAEDLASEVAKIEQRIGEGEAPEEELGLEVDEFTCKEWRKPGIVYHHGVTGIAGNLSEEPFKDLLGLEQEIYLKQIIDKANISEFQTDVILSIFKGISQTEYAKLHNIKPERVWKEKERAIKKMKLAAEKLDKKVK